jgi:alpha-2-macroglobulin-like protein
MNPSTPVDEQLLSDYVFGLLEPADVAHVEALLASDAAWQAAHAKELQFEAALNVASRGDFSNVTFRAPEQSLAQKTLQEVRASKETQVDPDQGVGYGIWVRRILLASLFLAVCALALPIFRDLVGFAVFRPAVVREATELEKLIDIQNQAKTKLDQATSAATEQVAQERKRVDGLFNEWLAASRREKELYANSLFNVTVKGPLSANPGRPNEYSLRVERRPSLDAAPELFAEVKDSAGEVLYRQNLEGTTDRKFTIPANVWSKVKSGSGLTLDVLAKDPKTQKMVTVRPPVNLFEPMFSTFLTTDKPLYKPGEKIYFRTLTLEQSRLMPPETDLTFQFELLSPDGKRIPTIPPVIGLTRSVEEDSSGGFTPVLGPDGKPIRGVASGSFALPANLQGGVYKILVTEASPSGFVPPNARPVAVRSFVIAGYNPDRFLKSLTLDARSYGPGDTVQAKINVKDQIRSVTAAVLNCKLSADGQEITLPNLETDPQGSANLRFTIPNKPDLDKLTLTVRVTSGATVETIVRPIPLRTSKLKLEFFPEGGDLVEGVPNRVYFRVTNIYGQPADCAGNLTDGEKSITPIRTLNDAEHPGVNQGLGLFEFTPVKGKTYSVSLTSPQGVKEPKGGFKLPSAVASGLALQVAAISEPGKPLSVKLFNQGVKRNLVVGAYVRGRPLAHEKLTMDAGATQQVNLDVNSPMGGVTRVTVFEELPNRDDIQPIAERLIFRQTSQALNINVEGLKQNAPYIPGESVDLSIKASNESGQPVGAILWAAVVNQSVLNMANDKTECLLPTHFLLNGEIENADQLEEADFLLTSHPKAIQSLDMLLGTQGWRRFIQAPKTANEPINAFLSISSPVNPSRLIRNRPAVRSVFEEYWPRYEAAAVEMDRMERRLATGDAVRAEQDEFSAAQGQVVARKSALEQAAKSLWMFQINLESRAYWLPVTAVSLVLGVLFCLIGMRKVGMNSNLRALFRRAIFVIMGLALLECVSISLPLLLWSGWKQYVSEEYQYSRSNRYAYRSPAPVMSAVTETGGESRPLKLTGRPTPAQLPANNAPFALGNPVAPPIAKPKLDVPFAPLGQFNNANARVAQDPVAPMSPAAARLQKQINFLSEQDRSAFLDVPKMPPMVVRSFSYVRDPSILFGTRAGFAETLLWHPTIVVNENSAAKVSFQISDNLDPYRLLIAGHTLDGRLGSVSKTLEVRKPFAVQPKLPLEISSADKLDVPLVLLNDTQDKITANLDVRPTGMRMTASGLESVPVEKGSSRKVIRLEPTIQQGVANLSVGATTSKGISDRVNSVLNVVPDGFLIQGNRSQMLEGNARVNVNFGQWIPGTVKATITIYPNTLSELESGISGLLREPHGCFEQASSSNYPNVLVLDYLRERGLANAAAADRATGYLQRGYSKLVGYECPKTGSPTRIGYEWFGAADRPHEALTAYGLLQFTDMARVYPVENDMLQRTKRFLLDSRDGQGGFRRDTLSIDRFGSAPDHVTNAYILWAITESEKVGQRSDLSKEFTALLKLTENETIARDPYFLALLGNALHNSGQKAEALKLFKKLGELQSPNGSLTGATASITRSTGRDLLIESTALTLLGWMKAERVDLFGTKIPLAMTWLNSQRGPSGAVGGTQATVLALKAIVEYSRLNKHPLESVNVGVSVGISRIGDFNLKSDSATPLVIEIPGAERLFSAGDNFVSIFAGTRQAYPMSVSWSYRSLQPNNSNNCPFQLSTKLSQGTVSEGDSVRLDVSLKNTELQGQGMAIAVIGLPAGLKLPEDRAELRQLTAIPKDGGEPKISYWETNGRELILYWRGLSKSQSVDFSLNLIAEVPGEYRGPASRAYLYYGSEHKNWIAPLAIKILPK